MTSAIWVSPGAGSSLGVVKTLLHGVDAAAPCDWDRKSSLLVELHRFAVYGLDEEDRRRLAEIVKRAQEGREL